MKKIIFSFLFAILFSSNLFAAYTTVRMPAGTILQFAGSTCPKFTVAADASSLVRAGIYANLFSAIGTTYGSVDGTHFTVPDGRGVFLRGAGSQTIGGLVYSGVQGVSANDTTKKNGLSLGNPGHTHTFVNTNGGARSGGGIAGGAAFTDNTGASTTGVYLNGGDSETRPANISVLTCIWY
jgi:microcystin-dependent protein